MKLRLVISILGLFALTTAEEKQCHACIDNICYDIQNMTQNYHHDRLLTISENYVIDRVDNLVYFVSSVDSLEIRTLNLTDKATKTVLTVTQTIRSIAFNESSRDLYYSLNDGDLFKYNLLTNQTVSLLKPVSGDSERPQVVNLVIISNKLFATMMHAATVDDFEYPRLFEYVPEESVFKIFAPLKDVELYDPPIANSRGDIYFKASRRLYRLRAGSKSMELVHEDRMIYGMDSIGEITVIGTDNSGVPYFVPKFGKKLYRLMGLHSNVLLLVGAIDASSIKSINFDKYNNLLYVDLGLRYLTASSESCDLRSRGLYGIEIVKTTDY